MSQFTDTYPSLLWSIKNNITVLNARDTNFSCTFPHYECNICPLSEAFTDVKEHWCNCNSNLPTEEYDLTITKLREDAPECLI